MRAREAIFAVCCALSGAVAAYAVHLTLGDWPTPTFYFSLIVIGLGSALVTIRYGRLGPFDGEIGPPRFESDLRERIAREADRAVRYGRSFTVLAVRDHSRASLRAGRRVRAVDDVIQGRRGLMILLLPETDAESALVVLQRMMDDAPQPIQAAMASCPADGQTGDELSASLLRLIRVGAAPGTVLLRGHGMVEALRIAG